VKQKKTPRPKKLSENPRPGDIYYHTTSDGRKFRVVIDGIVFDRVHYDIQLRLGRKLGPVHRCKMELPQWQKEVKRNLAKGKANDPKRSTKKVHKALGKRR